MSIRRTQDKQRLVLIDGHAILHRAFHALPPLTTSKGELVNAVFGFCSMLLKVRDELHPACFAVTFDLPAPTFRKKLYKNYQIKRPKMAEELSGQIEKLKGVLKEMKIPIYEKAGFEADDVIGTLAKQAVHSQQSTDYGKKTADSSQLAVDEVIIVTGDRDLLQLIDEHTKVYMLIKGLTEATLFDRAKVKDKYCLEPEQIPDYKALIGDASDNYPGVNGIGPKTAVSLLERFSNLEQIYKDLDDVELGIREKLEKGREDAQLSFQLATINRQVPVKLDLGQCGGEKFNSAEVQKIFEELEFKSLIPRLAGKVEKPESKKKPVRNASHNDAGGGKKDDGQMGLF